MSETRDPRRDPQRGDILRKKYHGQRFECWAYNERKVDEASGQLVAYVGEGTCVPEISLKSWRRWAKDAEVIRHA